MIFVTKHFREMVGVGIVLAIAAVMRLYSIREESVWLDEYFSVAYLDQPDLISFLRAQRHENWEMVPLYYILQYLWAKIYPGSIIWVRCLSVIFGLVSALSIYLIGRRFFNPICGLMALLLFSLSPFQLFHSQEIRTYALVASLSLISSFAFLEWYYTKRHSFFLLHGLANLWLVWTHLLSPLLFVAQGIFLQVVQRRTWQERIPWYVVHVLVLASVIPLVIGIKPAPDPQVPKPSVGNIWHFISDTTLRNDGSLIHKAFLNEGEYIRWTLGTSDVAVVGYFPPLVDFLVAIYRPLDNALGRLLMWALTLVIFYLLLRLFYLFKKKTIPDGHSAATFYIVLCFLIPLGILFLLAQFWKPHIFQSRYIIYCWPFLYLSCGIFLQLLRTKWVQWLYAFSVVGCMSLLGLLGVLLPIRPDYLGAVRFVSQHLGPEGEMICSDYNTLRLMQFNAKNLPVVSAYYDDGDALLSYFDISIGQQKESCFIFCGEESLRLRNRITMRAVEKNVPCIGQFFPGMQFLFAYYFNPSQTKSIENPVSPEAPAKDLRLLNRKL